MGPHGAFSTSSGPSGHFNGFVPVRNKARLGELQIFPALPLSYHTLLDT